METRFQTSFIPKKAAMPVGGGMVPGNVGAPPKKSRVGSIFMTLATLLFIVSLLSVGGAYAWQQYLLSSQQSYKAELASREQQFNLDLIEQLQSESIKITTAKQLIAGHLAMSKIFGVIAAMTAANVRFTSMDATSPDPSTGGDISVTLSGYGKDLSAVAFQSDVLGQLSQYGLSHIVVNPIISNPTLDQSGTVSFGLSASVDPSSLSYESQFGAPSGSASLQQQASSSPSQP